MTKQDRPPIRSFHGAVTAAPEMERFFDLASRVARTDASVLIRGETGTGKELAARALHALSPRRDRPFRAVNCATLTPELLASELFGHVKGAFTGAIRDRRGLFQLADRGTLFLDEVAEIPLDIQARLLRVLQERTFSPLGGAESVRVDVRLLTATHRSLRREVEAGRFREDLMYRIRVVPLFLPPLRERQGDIEALTWHFIDEFNQQGFRTIETIGDCGREALLGHRWPGNVRELRNALEFAFAVGEGPVLLCSDLPPELRGEGPPEPEPRELTVTGIERERIVDALRQARGRKGAAAELLGMSRSTLWRKLREHGLQ
jgi:two-component system, NtrC family, response regulator AtoC